MDYENISTPALIEKCIARNGLAWAEFVRRFLPLITFSIKKVLFAYRADSGAYAEDIKDIEQELIASIMSRNTLNAVRNRDVIDYWLAAITRNATLNHLKRKKREILIGENDYFEKFSENQFNEDTCETAIEEKSEKLKTIYAGFSQQEKIVFKFYFKNKFLVKDISKMTRIPRGTVSSLILRIRKKFKK